MLVFGCSGKPILVFPSSEGRFFDYENFGMIEGLRPSSMPGKFRFFASMESTKEDFSKAT